MCENSKMSSILNLISPSTPLPLPTFHLALLSSPSSCSLPVRSTAIRHPSENPFRVGVGGGGVSARARAASLARGAPSLGFARVAMCVHGGTRSQGIRYASSTCTCAFAPALSLSQVHRFRFTFTPTPDTLQLYFYFYFDLDLDISTSLLLQLHGNPEPLPSYMSWRLAQVAAERSVAFCYLRRRRGRGRGTRAWLLAA